MPVCMFPLYIVAKFRQLTGIRSKKKLDRATYCLRIQIFEARWAPYW